MKLALLAVALSLLTQASFAELTAIGESTKAVIMVDPELIDYAPADRNTRLAVMISVLKAPDPVFNDLRSRSGLPVRSVIQSMEFDCKHKRSKIILGELLDDDLQTIASIEPTALSAPLHRTASELELRYACSYPIKLRANHRMSPLV